MKIEVLPVGLMLLLGASACQGRTENAGRDQSAASAATPPDTGAPGAGGGAPAATPKGGLGDSNIVALLDEANMADSSAGAVALKKATNPDVKAFAKLMMADHHALRVAGQDLAKQLGVTPKPPERDPLAGYVKNEMDAKEDTQGDRVRPDLHRPRGIDPPGRTRLCQSGQGDHPDPGIEGADRKGDSGHQEAPGSGNGNPEETGVDGLGESGLTSHESRVTKQPIARGQYRKSHVISYLTAQS